jgi:UDP-N-acetylmuramoyl-L-alanyl-D-glutamate--2,6-diaminopimelate ligase
MEGQVAEIYYGNPSQKISIIGVTGTDGKTTTVHLIYDILKNSGESASMISSIDAYVAGKTYDTGFHTTTPRPWTVRKFLADAVKHGDKYFVLETTSHAIDQNRVHSIPFKIAVLTNVTQDHLYHHKTFENYINIKCRLLLESELPIINLDFDAAVDVIRILQSHDKKYLSYSINNKKADLVWKGNIKTNISGNFNRENILASYLCCRELGISDDKILQAIETFTLPQGRFDIVYDEDFKIIIDFAHTPNSFTQLLTSVANELKPKGRIIHVFGAASQRDNSKRSLMGRASGMHADIIILTEEDYRREDFNKICDQIITGLVHLPFTKVEENDNKLYSGTKLITVIKDRTCAINKAIEVARPGDVVVLTGKGHEKSLNRDGREVVWDEYEAVQQAIKNR